VHESREYKSTIICRRRRRSGVILEMRLPTAAQLASMGQSPGSGHRTGRSKCYCDASTTCRDTSTQRAIHRAIYGMLSVVTCCCCCCRDSDHGNQSHSRDAKRNDDNDEDCPRCRSTAYRPKQRPIGWLNGDCVLTDTSVKCQIS